VLKKIKRILMERMGQRRGEILEGMCDYCFRYPQRADTWGGPFNGQTKRSELFLSMISACEPSAIIETGTYTGNSTEFIAKASKLPVYSVEANRRNFVFARMRLIRYGNVRLSLGDSREFLTNFVERHSARYAGRPLLFYLDAHWGEDLPLSDELKIIFQSLPRAIVMIDDFEVPGDAGYAYDDYGSGKTLTHDYIASLVKQYELIEFYPKAPSVADSGQRRGCVVLARDPGVVDALSRMSVLRKWVSEAPPLH
jgi:predicted O-methyltransferase YrrM